MQKLGVTHYTLAFTAVVGMLPSSRAFPGITDGPYVLQMEAKGYSMSHLLPNCDGTS